MTGQEVTDLERALRHYGEQATEADAQTAAADMAEAASVLLASIHRRRLGWELDDEGGEALAAALATYRRLATAARWIGQRDGDSR